MQTILQLELFSLVSFICIGLLLFLTHKYVSETNRKYCYLASALLCVLTHYSYFFYQIVTGTMSDIPANLYLPEWPCNIMMWLILIIAILNFFKDNLIKKYLFYITSWVGTLCAIFGLCINFNFLSTPDLSDFSILKGLLSHVFLLYCCIFPIVEKKANYNFFKITFSALISGFLFILCGNYTKLILKLLKKEVGVSILLSPFDKLPWLNLYVMFPLIIILWIIVATVYEVTKLKKEDRWFNNLKNILEELKGD